MKRKFLMILTTLVLCFCMAGCGGGGGEDASDTGENAEKAMATSIVGEWECVDMTMVDNGLEMNKDDLEDLFSKEVSEIAAITAYEDGTGEITFMGIEGTMTWTESEGVYTINIDESDEEDAAPLKAEIDDGCLVVTSETGYSSDDSEAESVITMKFECITE